MATFNNKIVTTLENLVVGQGNVENASAVIKDYGKKTKQTQQIVDENTDSNKKNNTGMRKMLFTYLGALFLSQALSSAFLGLFRSSAPLAGIFEAIGNIIDIALLPAFLPFALALLALSLWFLDLPEPMRKFIGNGILVAGVAFLILFWFAQVKLGTEGLIWAFGGLIGSFKQLIGVVAPFIWRILAFVVILSFAIAAVHDLRTEGNELEFVMKAIAIAAGILAGIIAGVLGASFGTVLGIIAAVIAGVYLLIKGITWLFGIKNPFEDWAKGAVGKLRGFLGIDVGKEKEQGFIPTAPGFSMPKFDPSEFESSVNQLGSLNINVSAGPTRDQIMATVMRELNSQLDRRGVK